MFRVSFAWILTLILAIPVSAQETGICGKGVDFAGDSVTFFTYREPLFNIRYPQAQTRVDENGNFLITIPDTTTKCIHAGFGPYDGYVYIEPGKSYCLHLPGLGGISSTWRLDPSFERIRFHLETEVAGRSNKGEPTGLNEAIRAFDNEYYPFRDKQLLRYYSPAYSKARLDSFQKVNPARRDIDGADFYRRYLDYSIGLLEYAVKAYNTDSLLERYFVNQPVYFGLRPYRDLFNLLYDSYFLHLSKKIQYRDIFSVFTDSSYTALRKYLKRDPALANDTILETVLLKEIYNSYYSGDFARRLMTALTDSVRKNTEISVCRDMAEEAIRRFTRLQPGTPAPSFDLPGTDGKDYSLKDFRGKYVCLGFCNTKSITCLREFEYLRQIAARHSSYLSVVTIIPAADPASVKRFVEQNNIEWPVLITTKPAELYHEYNVKAFPVFYLIDKQGKVIRAPVPNPSEGFEQVLFRVMKQRGDI